MAKAKKTEKTETPAAPKKKAAANPTGGTPASAPLVDTSLVAQAAAKQLTAGVSTGNAGASAVAPSAAFKHLKDSLNKPTLSGLDSVLDKTGGGKKSGLPSHAFGKQTGRNQTFGADVNRAGVPRRTGGG